MTEQRLEQVKRRKIVPPPVTSVPEDVDDEREEEEEILDLREPEPVRQQAKVSPKKIETLEDIYAVYPQIGDGEFRLRIERVAPKTYGGQHIAGWLMDIDERPSMSDLYETFGGGRYNVIVLGPANGRSDARTLVTIEVSIPGPPSMNFLPQTQGDPMQVSRFQQGHGGNAMEPPQVQIKRLDMEERQINRLEDERRRLQEEAMLSRTAPEHVVRALTAQSDKTVTELKSLADSQISLLREQTQTLMAELSKKENELVTVRNQLVLERQATVEARTKAEHETERRLKEAHDALMHAITKKHDEAMVLAKDQATREISSVKDQAMRDINALESRNKERMDEASRRYQEDLTRITTSASRDIDRSRQDSERAEKALKETYEARIADLQRSTEREIRSVIEQRDREVASLKLTYDSSEKFSQQATTLRVDTLRSELERIRSDAERLKAENETLRASQHKDPQTYLRETREVAETLLDMVPRSEASGGSGDAEEEKEFDWKKEAAKGALGLLQQAPAIADKILGARQQQQAMMQQQAIMQQQAMMQQQQPLMLPPQQRPGLPPQQVRRRGVAPDSWNSSSQMLPTAEDIPFQPPVSRPIVQPVQAPQQSAQQPVSIPESQVLPVAESQEAYSPVSAEQTPEMAQINAFAAAFAEFVGEMEKAIQGEIVSPEMFARAFVARVGGQQAAELLTQVPVQNFLGSVEEQSGGATVLVTRDGKQYARAVWAEAARIIQGGTG